MKPSTSKFLLTLGLLLALTLPGVAEKPSPSLEDLTAEVQSLQVQMVGVFQALESPKEVVEAFQVSARAWQSYVDAQARFEALLSVSKPGEYQRKYTEASLRLTKERIDYLRSLLAPVSHY